MSGSPRKFTYDGTTYNVVNDADIQQTPSKTVENIRHSGGNSAKVTDEAQQAEAIKLKLTREQWDVLDQASGTQGVPMSITYQDGSVSTSPGYIAVGNWTSADAVCEIVATPDDRWETFGAQLIKGDS